MHESWLAILKDELTKPYFLKVPSIQFLKYRLSHS